MSCPSGPRTRPILPPTAKPMSSQIHDPFASRATQQVRHFASDPTIPCSTRISSTTAYIPHIFCPKPEYIYQQRDALETHILSGPGISSVEDAFPSEPHSNRDFATVSHDPSYHVNTVDPAFNPDSHFQYGQQSRAYPSGSTAYPSHLDPRYLSPRAAVQHMPQEQTYPAVYSNTEHQPYSHRYYQDSDSEISIGAPARREPSGPASNANAFGHSGGHHVRMWAERTTVATDKIREASYRRRTYSASIYCPICGDDFTTAFARDRHLVSHTGRRDFPCTIKGCRQRFSTDSGRKRHERSPTLHRA